MKDIREESTVPPPGFQPFEWPQADWDDIGDATLDPGLKFVSWSARIMWRSRVEHVCRVVYLWCTVCCYRCHLWRTLPYSVRL